MIALVSSPMHHPKSIGLADLLSMTYPKIFAQQTRRNIPFATLWLCFSTAAAAARLPRRILGAEARRHCIWRLELGHVAVVEQLISAKATVDAANDDGRGPGRVFGSFWECLWRDDGRGSHMGRWFSFVALGCWVVQGQGGNLCRGCLLVPQTVCRCEVHDVHVILTGWINCLWHWYF